jgi:hypothetical protein
MDARQSSKLQGEVRLLGEALTIELMNVRPRGVPDVARDPAKVEGQVRLLARTLFDVAEVTISLRRCPMCQFECEDQPCFRGNEQAA